MWLLFTDDKVADEVPCVVGVYHRASFGTYTSFTCSLSFHNRFLLFAVLQRFSVRRSGIDKPISCWFYEIISSQHPIVINQSWWHNKVCFEIRLLTPRILHNEPQTSFLNVPLCSKKQCTLPVISILLFVLFGYIKTQFYYFDDSFVHFAVFILAVCLLYFVGELVQCAVEASASHTKIAVFLTEYGCCAITTAK